jgi:hypothetical protein
MRSSFDMGCKKHCRLHRSGLDVAHGGGPDGRYRLIGGCFDPSIATPHSPQIVMHSKLHTVLHHREEADLIVGAQGRGGDVIHDVERILGIEDVGHVKCQLLADLVAVEPHLKPDVGPEIALEPLKESFGRRRRRWGCTICRLLSRCARRGPARCACACRCGTHSRPAT